MNIIERIQRIQEKPYWLRLLVYIILSTIWGLHLRWCQKLFLEHCSLEDCPPLPMFRFNANRWKYPERAYMESIQKMHLEGFIRLWTFLIPECSFEFKEAYRVVRQYFGSFAQVSVEPERMMTNQEVDRIPMEKMAYVQP